MSGGRAYGADRAFQVLCRDICIQRSGNAWKPYGDTDGIDVPLEAAGTTWTFDVVLENAAGDLLVAECKRWADSVPQGEVAKLAHTVERLRQAGGRAVSGQLFVKTDVQPGALAHACHEGIEVVISGESQPLPAFSITVLRYDAERDRRLQIFLASYVDTATVTDRAEGVITRPDGSVDKL